MSTVYVPLWALCAKAANKPMWRLLGGRRCEIKACGGGIDLDFTLDQLLAETKGFPTYGLQATKIKIGPNVLEQDIDRVQAMV